MNKVRFTFFVCVAAALLVSPLYASTFNVKDYGAKGDGVTNDQPAIQSAINAAIAAGAGNIVALPTGVYLLTTKNAATGNIFDINKSASLTFRGAGPASTKLISTQKITKLFEMDNNSNLLVEGFTADFSPRNYSQGTITQFSLSDKTVTFTIDPGFDQPDRPDLLPAGCTSLYLWSNPKRVSYDAYWGGEPSVTKYREISPGVWVFTLNYMPTTAVFAGEKGVIWGRDGNHALEFDSNHNFSLYNVKLYDEGWHTAFFSGGNTGEIKLTDFDVLPGPGNMLSAGSGSMCGNRGELIMDGCHFIVHDDDGMNTEATWQRLSAQPAANEMTVGHGDHQANDRLEVWNWPLKGQGDQIPPSWLTSLRITSVQRNSAGQDVLTLSGDVTLADGFANYKVIDLNQAGPVVIKNSSFSSSRARPLLLKSGTSISVENCLIYDSPAPLKLGSEMGWGEGPRPINITVKNNVFRDMDMSAVFVGVDGAVANNLATNLVIEGNMFENGGQETIYGGQTYTYGNPIWVQNATSPLIAYNVFRHNWDTNIAVKYCNDVHIVGNKFEYPNEIEPTHPDQVNPTTVIFADSTDGLTLSGNSMIGPGQFNKSFLYLTNSVSNVTAPKNILIDGPGAAK